MCSTLTTLPSTMGPTWAEVAGRGGVQPPVGHTHSNSPPPPAPARQQPSHPFDTLLKLYRGCVQESRWARLTLETCDGEEQLNFCCSSRHATAAGAAFSSVAPTACRRVRKRPPNERRREKERKRQEVRKEKRRAAFKLAAAAQAVLEPSSPAAGRADSAALAAVIPTAAAACVVHFPESVTTIAAIPVAAAPTAAAIPAADALTAAATPTAATPSAAANLAATAPIAAAIPGAAATAALRERTKMTVGDRRARARILSLAKRREGNVLGSPETIRMTEMEAAVDLEISLDLEDREIVLSPSPQKELEDREISAPSPATAAPRIWRFGDGNHPFFNTFNIHSM